MVLAAINGHNQRVKERENGKTWLRRMWISGWLRRSGERVSANHAVSLSQHLHHHHRRRSPCRTVSTAARCIEFKCILRNWRRGAALRKRFSECGNNICLAKNCDCNFRVAGASPRPLTATFLTVCSASPFQLSLGASAWTASGAGEEVKNMTPPPA